ncbi:uncharacterized protein (TIGR00369 family) [Kitasatospora sp. GP30]|nr:uncharacterized protein (TIGR00369 family) [Kitasatospora sp. GP30]
MASMPITVVAAEKILAENFAPWVLELGLTVTETGERHAVLRMPWSDRLAREGGGICGQALMAAADTACAVAITSARGGFGPMTTVQQSTSFQRPMAGADVMITARVTKLGRQLAFIEVDLTAGDATDPAAHASAVYAFPA